MRVERIDGCFRKGEWGCRIENVLLQRGSGERTFELVVPDLALLADEKSKNILPLMGRTGAGKSTLLNLISAMDWPTAGRVTWKFPDNKTIDWDHSGLSSSEAKQLRCNYFGYAFQDSTLIPHLSVIDNLSYPLKLRGKIKCKKKIKIKAEARLAQVLIENETVSNLSSKYPSQLSGGQRQRVALAQAMIHDPYVLFADEPTGSLDSETRRQVMDVIHAWVDKVPGKRSLLWVTHHDTDPADAGLSHRLLVNDGKCKRDPELRLIRCAAL